MDEVELDFIVNFFLNLCLLLATSCMSSATTVKEGYIHLPSS